MFSLLRVRYHYCYRNSDCYYNSFNNSCVENVRESAYLLRVYRMSLLFFCVRLSSSRSRSSILARVSASRRSLSSSIISQSINRVESLFVLVGCLSLKPAQKQDQRDTGQQRRATSCSVVLLCLANTIWYKICTIFLSLQ